MTGKLSGCWILFWCYWWLW